jgi:hypothetical protein
MARSIKLMPILMLVFTYAAPASGLDGGKLLERIDRNLDPSY